MINAECSLRVEMDDGSWWDVPTKIIASSRATSLAEAAESSRKDSFFEAFRQAYEETLMNEEILIDWAESHLTWDEVHDFAKIVRAPNVSNYAIGWKTGMKMLVK
jgi:hypothetical protein